MVGPQGDDYLPVLEGQKEKKKKKKENMKRKDLSCLNSAAVAQNSISPD